MAMQEVLISVVNRSVHGTKGISKIITVNVCLRPSNLSEIRKLEFTLERQIQIYEYGKFKEPGSLEGEFAIALCNAQMKTV
jgi:hypothetical protein